MEQKEQLKESAAYRPGSTQSSYWSVLLLSNQDARTHTVQRFLSVIVHEVPGRARISHTVKDTVYVQIFTTGFSLIVGIILYLFGA